MVVDIPLLILAPLEVPPSEGSVPRRPGLAGMIWSLCCTASRITYCNGRIWTVSKRFQGINKAGQVQRQGALECQPGPRAGMTKPQGGSMEGLAVQLGEDRAPLGREAGAP